MDKKCLMCGTLLVTTSSIYCNCLICGVKYKINNSGLLEVIELIEGDDD